MIEHTFLQGSEAWHAHRATARNASDAAVIMGCHPTRTRDEWLRERFTSIAKEHSRFVEENVFAPGHAVEAAMRPVAESIIGEDLGSLVGSETVDGIELSASFDGLTLMSDAAWECKSLNAQLREWFGNYDRADIENPENRAASELPLYYRTQMQQQCMVSGCARILFTASDGKGDDRHCWYYPDAGLGKAIIAAWKQADIDAAAYVPIEIIEKPKAEVKQALPALFIHAKGEITDNNLKDYGFALAAELNSIRSIALVTDQDFSNAKASAQFLRDQIQSAKLTKEAMLAQTATVGEAARMIDAWCEDMRLTALQLEKDVEREDRAKKEGMILAARQAYSDHVASIEAALQPIRLGALSAPNFAEAIKGKRNYASMHDAINTALANGKIAADAMGKDYTEKKAWLKSEAYGCMSLFPDSQALMLKPMDDFQLVVKTRIAAKVADDARREDESRERIRAEEKAKAESEAREKVLAEQVLQKPVAPTFQEAMVAVLPEPVAAMLFPPVANVVHMPAPTATPPAETHLWQTCQTLPEVPMQWIEVRETNLYRFMPYKENSTEFKRGKKGRWQRHSGDGFDNAEPQAGPWRVADAADDAERQAA